MFATLWNWIRTIGNHIAVGAIFAVAWVRNHIRAIAGILIFPAILLRRFLPEAVRSFVRILVELYVAWALITLAIAVYIGWLYNTIPTAIVGWVAFGLLGPLMFFKQSGRIVRILAGIVILGFILRETGVAEFWSALGLARDRAGQAAATQVGGMPLFDKNGMPLAKVNPRTGEIFVGKRVGWNNDPRTGEPLEPFTPKLLKNLCEGTGADGKGRNVPVPRMLEWLCEETFQTERTIPQSSTPAITAEGQATATTISPAAGPRLVWKGQLKAGGQLTPTPVRYTRGEAYEIRANGCHNPCYFVSSSSATQGKFPGRSGSYTWEIPGDPNPKETWLLQLMAADNPPPYVEVWKVR